MMPRFEEYLADVKRLPPETESQQMLAITSFGVGLPSSGKINPPARPAARSRGTWHRGGCRRPLEVVGRISRTGRSIGPAPGALAARMGGQYWSGLLYFQGDRL